MKKIQVSLTEKSIDRAIKEIQEYQKHFVKLVPKFLSRCADRVVELANERIETYEYDSEIIEGIKGGWIKEEGKDFYSLTLSNTYEKAVFVEFGVGQVGAEKSHEAAGGAGYSYDVHAHGDKGWGFYLSENEPLDLLQPYYKDFFRGGQNKFYIWTKGSPATMFLYQAAMDFADHGEFVPIMEDLLKGL